MARVVSGDLLHQVAISVGLTVGDGERIALRGRQGRVEAHLIHSPADIAGLL
jgi:hypothetical protein